MHRIAIVLLVIAVLGTAFWIRSGMRTIPPVRSDLSISTSIYPLFFFAGEIAGNAATVRNIIPPGAEPHDFEPGPKDIAAIEASEFLILNGGNLEPWAAKLEGQGKVKIITAGESLVSNADPHIWLSPPLAKAEALKILSALIAIDPLHRSEYEARSRNLEKKLDALNRKFIEGLRSCQRRDFVTSHAAFSYLASAYGLKQVAISGLSPEEEPSIRKLAEISSFVKTQGIKYVFFETLISPKLAQTIAEEAEAQVLVLNPLEGLTGDEMKAGRNYFTIMEENLANLRIALACR